MREILFRGKCLDSGEWVYGDFLHKYNFENENGIVDVETGIVKTVDIDTVCEFTGLYDKNGVKIFEGDILKSMIEFHLSSFDCYNKGIPENTWGVVEYCGRAFFVKKLATIIDGTFVNGEYYHREYYIFDDYPDGEWDEFENCIIEGNIYDNKDFVEDCMKKKEEFSK